MYKSFSQAMVGARNKIDNPLRWPAYDVGVICCAVIGCCSCASKRPHGWRPNPIVAVVQKVGEKSSEVQQTGLPQLIVGAARKTVAVPVKLVFPNIHRVWSGERTRLRSARPTGKYLIHAGRRLDIVRPSLVVIIAATNKQPQTVFRSKSFSDSRINLIQSATQAHRSIAAHDLKARVGTLSGSFRH